MNQIKPIIAQIILKIVETTLPAAPAIAPAITITTHIIQYIIPQIMAFAACALQYMLVFSNTKTIIPPIRQKNSARKASTITGNPQDVVPVSDITEVLKMKLVFIQENLLIVPPLHNFYNFLLKQI
ncbi:hypothetical protein EHI8A_063200 [Entamoeba histolytica HM-1:IMSS-B]|uniref:Uncharacterized protein n=5 Tax=Entamoeba histolytica TaxID=5759 RepID=B1N2T8_ENTH1|nr:hypothetical protein EHI_069590 [Entamoeba histolytica HM-1:IMSS]EMD49646.1 Hypothetical protein EHI5A_095930 [Entamoeba histolytica KU27]EMH77714.1 hypothetical protein EHI8A_063200 [Entamoeba histolytica HM-1:IMSS-B]EMS16302.1 hypothetical protein KM1_089900 [Entamoeba histolytica HM-3:IMSS]ENY62031.1 hypothetical protein EHI7A_065780 [Entamoeba histolytica HM-1:IMSS-A]EDS89722.1 hypothetical protein EHI_069590 [Entamoeba histolytica HM-1:IMSS]|eukprot:XP_001913504.1 hypothetical protein EHI_069590 [Entamoeba histolytica HM-1:IMSS]